MKTIKSILLLSLVAAVITFTGCSEEDAVGPSFDSITINGQTVSSITTTPNGSVIISATMVPGDTKLDEYKIERSLGNDITVVLSGNDIVIQKDTLTAANVIGEEIITLTVTDNDGLTDTKTITITTENIETPLATIVDGAFFHIEGTSKGAWDLVNDVIAGVSDAESIKDMKNNDDPGATFTGSWEVGTGNTTLFLADNSYDYDNATVESVAGYFSQANPITTSVYNPSVNDIYLVKLRGGNGYAAIKITALDPNDNTCGCGNTGKITFSYKKQ